MVSIPSRVVAVVQRRVRIREGRGGRGVIVGDVRSPPRVRVEIQGEAKERENPNRESTETLHGEAKDRVERVVGAQALGVARGVLAQIGGGARHRRHPGGAVHHRWIRSSSSVSEFLFFVGARGSARVYVFGRGILWSLCVP